MQGEKFSTQVKYLWFVFHFEKAAMLREQTAFHNVFKYFILEKIFAFSNKKMDFVEKKSDKNQTLLMYN